jgi:uncharacterized membrane protein required for colicin V production
MSHQRRCAAFMNWLNSIGKTMGGLTVGWVDFITLIIVLIGVVRGRKRGLSEEILDTIQWVLIVVTGALLYKSLSKALNYKPIFSTLTYYILSYLLIAMFIKIIFVLFKRKFGQKIVESDMFGRFEFYGGMAAGVVRFSCIYLFVLSLLHAPHYSPEFWAQRAKDVDYNYGSDFFPHPCKIQKSVFESSFTGTKVKKHAEILLIEQTDGSSKALRDDSSLAKRNERAIDNIMNGR